MESNKIPVQRGGQGEERGTHVPVWNVIVETLVFVKGVLKSIFLFNNVVMKLFVPSSVYIHTKTVQTDVVLLQQLSVSIHVYLGECNQHCFTSICITDQKCQPRAKPGSGGGTGGEGLIDAAPRVPLTVYWGRTSTHLAFLRFTLWASIRLNTACYY